LRLNRQQKLLRKYLLHDLAEAKEENIEMRLLTDKAFRRQVAIAEDDLIDHFIRARLSSREMKAFRTNYLTTPERVQKVKFVSALDKYSAAHAPALEVAAPQLDGTLRTRRLIFAVSVLACLLIAGFILFHFWGLRQRANELRRELIRLNQNQDLPLASILKNNSQEAVILVLRQNLVREGADSRIVNTTPDTKVITLLLEVAGKPQNSYIVTLQTIAGEDLSSLPDFKVKTDNGAQFIVVNLPARNLSRGDYQIRLTAIHSDGQATTFGLYPFQIATQ